MCNMKYLNLKFSFLNASFYLIYGIIYGYAAYYLEAKGSSGTDVGIVFSVSSAACIILQLFLGSFLDRNTQYSAKDIIFLFSIVLTASVAVLYFKPAGTISMLCFIIILMLLLVDSSLFNAFGMEYINAGYRLNYSLSRGIGSLAYSVATLIMGFAISRTSENIIIPAFMIVQMVVFFAMFIIKPAGRNQNRTCLSYAENKKRVGVSIFALLRKRPEVLQFLCGILLMYLSYTAINNFHINIVGSVGGGSRELGISTSIAAFIELPAMSLFLPLSKRFSFERLLRFSCFFFIVKVALMCLAPSTHAIYAIQTLQLLSYGLFIPSSTYYINSILDESDMAKGQTLLGIFTFGLSGLISSLLSGMILDRFNVRTLLIIMTFLAVAGFIITVSALRRIRALSQSY